MRTSLSNTIRRVSLESDEMQQDVELPLEAPVAESQGPEEWIVDTHQPLDEVRDSATLSGQLEDLTEVVEDAPLEASVESYHWMLNTLIQNAGMPTTRGVALENFTHSSGGKKLLASSIRNYNSNLKRSINIALENYTDGYAKVVSDNIEQYKPLALELKEKIDDFLEEEIVIKVSSKKIWELFHVKGSLLDMNNGIQTEVDNLDTLAKEIESKLLQVSKNPTGKVKLKAITKELMMNRAFVMSENGASFEVHKLPGTNTPASLTSSLALLGVGVFVALSGMAIVSAAPAAGLGALLLSAGLGVSAAASALAQKIRSVLNTVTTRGRKTFTDQVLQLLKLETVIGKIDKTLTTFANTLSKMDPEEAAEAKRTAAPMIEAAGLLVKHINEVMSGFVRVYDTSLSTIVAYTEVGEDGKVKGSIGKDIITGRTGRLARM